MVFPPGRAKNPTKTNTSQPVRDECYTSAPQFDARYSPIKSCSLAHIIVGVSGKKNSIASLLEPPKLDDAVPLGGAQYSRFVEHHSLVLLPDKGGPKESLFTPFTTLGKNKTVIPTIYAKGSVGKKKCIHPPPRMERVFLVPKPCFRSGSPTREKLSANLFSLSNTVL